MRLSFSPHGRRTARAASRSRKTMAVTGVATAAIAMLATSTPAAHAIIGGTEVSNDAYPFMAAVMDKGSGSPLDRQFCGGSLVTADTIMTAAHCLVDDAGKPLKPKKLQVAVGRTVLSKAGQGQIRNVAKGGVVVHPRYLKGQEAYDVAFIQLSKPIRGISPIALPTQGTDALIRPGQNATVAGWGNTDTELPNTPDRLREVKVPILSHAECRTSYEEYDAKVNFCAGVETKDSCQGDSGGPIFRNVPGRRAPIQVGVVSYGDGCGAQGAPGVYTSVSSSKLWKTLGESAGGKKVKRVMNRR
ncbi:trypsin-like serine protease [Streptomyces sp. BA2]|nr:trypsin-like serine protease [Streptomyces sp. BA2]